VLLTAPDTPKSGPLDLPWTLDGGRGILGMDPVHGAIYLWLALMAFTLLFIMLSALLSRWQWGRLNRADARRAASEIPQLTPGERARLRTEASELIRQAAATAAAAKRAESAVQETRAMCVVAQQAREVAWTAFDTAQKAYEQALRETAQVTEGKDEKDEDGKRAVSRAALDAFRRGDITVDDLNAAFRQASGWNPLQELQAREVELRRSAESQARKAYQAAAAAERSALKAADVAVVAAHALAEEAIEVAQDAQAVREELTAAMRAQPAVAAKPRVPKQRGAQKKSGKEKRRPNTVLDLVALRGLPTDQTLDLNPKAIAAAQAARATTPDPLSAAAQLEQFAQLVQRGATPEPTEALTQTA